MSQATTLFLKEVQVEVTSMSPVFLDDRICVRRVMRDLYKKAKIGLVPYGFINALRRQLRKIGFEL